MAGAARRPLATATALSMPFDVAGVRDTLGRIHIPLRANHARVLLFLGDLVLLTIAVWAGSAISAGTTVTGIETEWLIVLCAIWSLLAAASRSYKTRRLAGPLLSPLGALKLMLATLLVYFMLPWSPQGITVRNALFIPALGSVLLATWRIGFARAVTSSVFQRRVLIVGAGIGGRELVQVIKEEDPGCMVVGFVDDNPGLRGRMIHGVPVIGTAADLRRISGLYPSADVVLAVKYRIDKQLLNEAIHLFSRGTRFVSLPQAIEQATGRVPVEHIGERWFLSLPLTRDVNGFYPLVKRVIDLLVSGAALLVLAPFFPFVALAIKRDSPGPVFYRPQRLGQGGKPFFCWKLRTMVADADCVGDPTFTGRADPRITTLGHFLRRAHIDELPQLINIFKGEMSIVGPRPERYVAEFEEAIPFYGARTAVKPGAAGWALVNQGYAEGTDGTLVKLQYDLYYIKHQSLWLDLLIIAKTIRDMVTGGGR